MIAVIVIVVIVVLIGLFFWLGYNGLVKRRNQVDNAWSQIDVQLKRRHDLIPNLVETVKGYAAHERGTFEAVTQARANAINAQTPADQAQAENVLSGALKSLFAVAEAYPDLKANQNFLNLQEELTSAEDHDRLRAAVLQRQRAELQHPDPDVPHGAPRRHVQLRRSASSSTPLPKRPRRRRCSSSQVVDSELSPLGAAAWRRGPVPRQVASRERADRGEQAPHVPDAVRLRRRHRRWWRRRSCCSSGAAGPASSSPSSSRSRWRGARTTTPTRSRSPPAGPSPPTRPSTAGYHNLVEGLCIAAGLPKPRLYVVDDPAPERVRDRSQPEARRARGHHRPARRS